MLNLRVSPKALLGLGITLGFASPLAISQSTAPAQPPPKEIHVDRSCKVLQEESDALSDYPGDLSSDNTICHLEGVFTSHHVEEAIKDGTRERNNVTIKEQEYLLQNVTAERVAFVVEHALPEGWTIDSDPAPVKVADNTAYFRVYAEPGQIARLHVGARHPVPIADAE